MTGSSLRTTKSLTFSPRCTTGYVPNNTAAHLSGRPPLHGEADEPWIHCSSAFLLLRGETCGRNLIDCPQSVQRDSEQNAALVAARILEAGDLLESHPEMGRSGRVLGTRELVVPDTPFIAPTAFGTKGWS